MSLSINGISGQLTEVDVIKLEKAAETGTVEEQNQAKLARELLNRQKELSNEKLRQEDNLIDMGEMEEFIDDLYTKDGEINDAKAKRWYESIGITNLDDFTKAAQGLLDAFFKPASAAAPDASDTQGAAKVWEPVNPKKVEYNEKGEPYVTVEPWVRGTSEEKDADGHFKNNTLGHIARNYYDVSPSNWNDFWEVVNLIAGANGIKDVDTIYDNNKIVLPEWKKPTQESAEEPEVIPPTEMVNRSGAAEAWTPQNASKVEYTEKGEPYVKIEPWVQATTNNKDKDGYYKNDTLSHIAMNYYGVAWPSDESKEVVNLLAKANGITDINMITSGQNNGNIILPKWEKPAVIEAPTEAPPEESETVADDTGTLKPGKQKIGGQDCTVTIEEEGTSKKYTISYQIKGNDGKVYDMKIVYIDGNGKISVPSISNGNYNHMYSAVITDAIYGYDGEYSDSGFTGTHHNFAYVMGKDGTDTEGRKQYASLEDFMKATQAAMDAYTEPKDTASEPAPEVDDSQPVIQDKDLSEKTTMYDKTTKHEIQIRINHAGAFHTVEFYDVTASKSLGSKQYTTRSQASVDEYNTWYNNMAKNLTASLGATTPPVNQIDINGNKATLTDLGDNKKKYTYSKSISYYDDQGHRKSAAISFEITAAANGKLTGSAKNNLTTKDYGGHSNKNWSLEKMSQELDKKVQEALKKINKYNTNNL